jgi:hypothetical protein
VNRRNRTIFGLLWLSQLGIRFGSFAAYPAPKTVPAFLFVVGSCVLVALCIHSGIIAKSLGRSAVGWVVASILSVGIAPIALLFLRPNVVPSSASSHPLASGRPGLASDPTQASPKATSVEITFGKAATTGLVAGVIYGILHLVFDDSQKGRMIAFAVVFVPSVMAIKPVKKKMASGAAFVVGALVSALIGAALRGK